MNMTASNICMNIWPCRFCYLGRCGPGPCGPPGPLLAGPLWAPLGPCGPGPCGCPGPLWAPWALVGRALVGSPGPLWAPWALMGRALVGRAPMGPYRPVPEIDPTGFNGKTRERSPFGSQRPDHGGNGATSSAPTPGSPLYIRYVNTYTSTYMHMYIYTYERSEPTRAKRARARGGERSCT